MCAGGGGGMLVESGGGGEPRDRTSPSRGFFSPSSDPILPHGCHFFFLFLSFSELLRRSKSREVGRAVFFSHEPSELQFTNYSVN